MFSLGLIEFVLNIIFLYEYFMFVYEKYYFKDFKGL